MQHHSLDSPEFCLLPQSTGDTEDIGLQGLCAAPNCRFDAEHVDDVSIGVADAVLDLPICYETFYFTLPFLGPVMRTCWLPF